jgi:periplasmic divalent cation tolerance protein
MNCIAVITTVASRDDARRIAKALVERRLVACAQISEIESLYHWDGALQDDPEFRLQLKTVDAQYDAVAQAIRELHPYDLPAIYALPVDRIDASYEQWVRDGSCGAAPRGTPDAPAATGAIDARSAAADADRPPDR